jgi:hypothetical protein
MFSNCLRTTALAWKIQASAARKAALAVVNNYNGLVCSSVEVYSK